MTHTHNTHTQSNHDDYAIFSADNRFRYLLVREVGNCRDGGDVVFLMLNPSTADAFVNDPTVGRCVKHARRLGFRRLVVLNLFAFRSPYPKDLLPVRSEIEDDETNMSYIRQWCGRAEAVIAAWGIGGALCDMDRRVCRELNRANVTLRVLGLTKDGFPKHPLARGRGYIPTEVIPQLWPKGKRSFLQRERASLLVDDDGVG